VISLYVAPDGALEDCRLRLYKYVAPGGAASLLSCLFNETGSERILKYLFESELPGLEFRLQAVPTPVRLKAGLQTEL